MVCLSRPYPFKYFKGCLPQNLLSPLLNTLARMSLAAETLALPDTAENGVYLSQMISERFTKKHIKFELEIAANSKSLHDILHSKKNVLEEYIRIVIALLNNFLIENR